MNRRLFLKMGVATFLASYAEKLFSHSVATQPVSATGFTPVTCENVPAGPDDLKIRFLGTGAAGWKPGSKGRRMSSVLVDNKFFIDFTLSVEDMLPKDVHPTEIFYTHSHGDHFQPQRALLQGIKKVYLSETWKDKAELIFRKAAEETSKDMPDIIPLKIGQSVEIHDIRATPLPANHATSNIDEQALIYLLEKGSDVNHLGVRLLYATDTGGLMGMASRLAGIDSHLKPGRPITAFVMEATMGIHHDEDFRIFNHSSALTVSRIVNMLTETGRYLPPAGQPAYLTHMSNSLHDRLSQDELNAVLPIPLRAAYDGLDVVFHPYKP